MTDLGREYRRRRTSGTKDGGRIAGEQFIRRRWRCPYNATCSDAYRQNDEGDQDGRKFDSQRVKSIVDLGILID